jgi:hypothetical protein
MLGRQVFFNAYNAAGGIDLTGRNGRDLRRQIVAVFSHRGRVENWLKAGSLDDSDYLRLRALYPNDSEKIVDGILDHPTKNNYWVLFSLPGLTTPQIPDRLFLLASIEHFKRHPVGTARAITATYKGLVLGPAWRFEDGPIVDPAAFDPATPARNAGVPAEIAAPMRSPPDDALFWETKVNTLFGLICDFIVPASFVLMLIGVVGFVFEPGPARATALTIFVLHCANAVVTALLVDAQFRYQVHGASLAMIGAGLGLHRLASLRIVRKALARAA